MVEDIENTPSGVATGVSHVRRPDRVSQSERLLSVKAVFNSHPAKIEVWTQVMGWGLRVDCRDTISNILNTLEIQDWEVRAAVAVRCPVSV